jgi:hypothetical protein
MRKQKTWTLITNLVATKRYIYFYMYNSKKILLHIYTCNIKFIFPYLKQELEEHTPSFKKLRSQ